ncbi:3-keto-disaccharide hydrolase [Rubinisphaera margarita]|uniref:3-keto-disaccharide hydrolase n=1 Tax=Rubinisphaera margarita TaxID=2909586 RepID=UPI001EE80BE3|nr:DUF1080 domain-containing protein [Rubinisphaera margarita]MCG6157956.1 DUF1080 domain-containing protein [Rubinisphaera margarita]
MIRLTQTLLPMILLFGTVQIGLAEKVEKGFFSLMPKEGKHLWEDSIIVTDQGYLDGDGCYIGQEFDDFVLRFEFKQSPGANSGIGIRSARGQNAAYSGMEIQCLEDSHPKYDDIQDWQHHGSVYGIVAAKQGSLKPPGEWNTQEIVVDGRHIKVTVNDQVIVDANLDEAAPDGKSIDGKEHPGLKRDSGYLRLCGHGGGVQFRKMRIKPLSE